MNPREETREFHPDDLRRVADEERCGAAWPDNEKIVAEPELSLPTTLVLFFVVGTLTAVTAEWLVESVGELAGDGRVSKEFVGLVLLPIVSNAAQHASALTIEVKDELTSSLDVAVESCIVSSLPQRLRR